MNYWLMKSEPSTFGIDDLARAKNSTSSWDGVRNFQARNYLREMQKGDLVFFYHSSCDVPGIAGVATVQREAYPDPKDATKKSYVVDVAPVKKLARPVTLAEVKADPAFADFPLVRMSRLSVMPVTDDEWTRIEKMSR